MKRLMVFTTQLFTNIGAGIDYKRLTVGIGYQYYTMGSMGYINIGVRLGKK